MTAPSGPPPDFPNAPPSPDVDDLVGRLLAGDRRALSRAITHVENGRPEGRLALAQLYARTGRAHVTGITGGSGAGKSTLTYRLALEQRRRGRSVGIVAVDPSSPFSHGAILGDRIRMQELTSDRDIFVRSMATRGELGGLAPMTDDVVAVLDAFGKDVVLVETVGAGQDEVEVASMADTTAVVVTPGGGDGVQAMKAGILEVADVLVINKADLPGADALAQQLQAVTPRDTHVPIVRTVATKGEGIGELADAIDAHREQLETSGDRERVALERARRRVLARARQRLLERLIGGPDGALRLDRLAASVAARELDPYTAAQRLVDGGS